MPPTFSRLRRENRRARELSGSNEAGRFMALSVEDAGHRDVEGFAEPSGIGHLPFPVRRKRIVWQVEEASERHLSGAGPR